MQLLASSILYQPVIELSTGRVLGRVKQLVIEPTSGRIEALLIRSGLPLFSRSERLLSMDDVYEILPHTVLVESEDRLLPLTEIVRAKQILNRQVPILGQRAITRSGRYLGRVTDLVFDPILAQVTRFQVQTLLQDLMLGADRVETVTSRAIVFADSVTEGQRSPMATLAID